MILINDWYFDFENMVAFRKGNSNDKKQLTGITHNHTILAKPMGAIGPFGSFFVRSWEYNGADKLNQKINEAYKEFLLSKEIEKILEE